MARSTKSQLESTHSRSDLDVGYIFICCLTFGYFSSMLLLFEWNSIQGQLPFKVGNIFLVRSILLTVLGLLFGGNPSNISLKSGAILGFSRLLNGTYNLLQITATIICGADVVGAMNFTKLATTALWQYLLEGKVPNESMVATILNVAILNAAFVLLKGRSSSTHVTNDELILGVVMLIGAWICRSYADVVVGTVQEFMEADTATQMVINFVWDFPVNLFSIACEGYLIRKDGLITDFIPGNMYSMNTIPLVLMASFGGLASVLLAARDVNLVVIISYAGYVTCVYIKMVLLKMKYPDQPMDVVALLVVIVMFLLSVTYKIEMMRHSEQLAMRPILDIAKNLSGDTRKSFFQAIGETAQNELTKTKLEEEHPHNE